MLPCIFLTSKENVDSDLFNFLLRVLISQFSKLPHIMYDLRMYLFSNEMGCLTFKRCLNKPLIIIGVLRSHVLEVLTVRKIYVKYFVSILCRLRAPFDLIRHETCITV